MAKVKAVVFSVILVLLTVELDALTLGAFENIASGVQDAWNQSNPENLRGGSFAAESGNGKLWLVSKRLHRTGTSDPWDSAARGGIVSTLQLSSKAQTHKPYDRLDEDTRGEKIFSLRGVLFLLTYSTNQNKIAFHKLFFWNEETSKWLETPFEIDPTASTSTTNSIQALSINVPKQEGSVAYVATSAHGNARPEGEIAFSKLEVEFRGTVPAKATLKPLAHEATREPSAVVFMAFKNDELYAFIENFYSEGYEPIPTFAYTLDLQTNQVANVTLGGVAPVVHLGEDTVHQAGNEVLVIGGTQSYLLGQLRTVDDIFALNLNTHQWQKTSYKIPQGAGRTSVYDQGSKKLYLIGLSEGVKAAQVTSS